MKILVASLAVIALTQAPPTPQTVVNELLGTDRTFGAEAAKTTAIPALSAMFADDVAVMVGVPAPGFARGKAQAMDALKANPDNAQGRVEWVPIRGGVSADGQHGFTFGYMRLTKTDGTVVPIKYVAYWVKKTDGWRVAVYKRVTAEQSPSSLGTMPPSLPQKIVAPANDAAAVPRHRTSLEAAERAFSDEAQKIGLGPAFAKHGHEDAVNAGPRSSSTFIVGAAAIGKSMGPDAQTPPSALRWAPDEGSIVASSGDLGVTFGFIRPNATPPAGQPAAIPFITIWRRASPNEPWRYIAE